MKQGYVLRKLWPLKGCMLEVGNREIDTNILPATYRQTEDVAPHHDNQPNARILSLGHLSFDK